MLRLHSHRSKEQHERSNSSIEETEQALLASVTSLGAQALDDLVEHAVAYATLHGLVMAGRPPPKPASDTDRGRDAAPPPATHTAQVVHAPFTLFPSPVPLECFLKARRLMAPLQWALDRLARDTSALLQTLKYAAQQDRFIGRLCNLLHSYPLLNSEPSLCIYRADYFITADLQQLQQVEVNTIASSFGALGTLVCDLHGQVLRRVQAEHARHTLRSTDTAATAVASEGAPTVPCLSDSAAALPRNGALLGMSEALNRAHRWWVERYLGVEAAESARAAVVLFVVQPDERNVYDQKWLELGLWRDHGVRARRRTLAQIAAATELPPAKSGGDGRAAKPTLYLCTDTPHGRLCEPVSVVYFRAGYVPDDYPTEAEWQARERIAASNAVSCPSLAHHLVGTKKVQQWLSEAGVLERYLLASPETRETLSQRTRDALRDNLFDRRDVEQLRSTFVAQFSFEQPDARAAAVQRALQHPEAYVLKPQREGGGHNLFGERLVRALQETQSDSDSAADAAHPLTAYILMERIHPTQHPNILVRDGAAHGPVSTVAELGIFGVFFGSSSPRADLNVSTYNQAIGHLLRTKFAHQEDGGVAAGVAALDSPWLLRAEAIHQNAARQHIANSAE